MAQYKSVETQGLTRGAGGLVYDHAIPFRYQQAKLLELEPLTLSNIKQILEEFGVFVLITSEQDSLLRKAGLGHKMPKDWDGHDPLARYKAVDIQLLANDVTRIKTIATY